MEGLGKAAKGQKITLLLPHAIVLAAEPKLPSDLSLRESHYASSVKVGAFLVPFCYPRAQPRALPRVSITTCVLKSLRARACGDVCMYTWACSPNWKSGLGHGRVQIIHIHSGSLRPAWATVLRSESPVCGLGMMVFISVQAPGKLVFVSTASQGSWESCMSLTALHTTPQCCICLCVASGGIP